MLLLKIQERKIAKSTSIKELLTSKVVNLVVEFRKIFSNGSVLHEASFLHSRRMLIDQWLGEIVILKTKK